MGTELALKVTEKINELKTNLLRFPSFSNHGLLSGSCGVMLFLDNLSLYNGEDYSSHFTRWMVEMIYTSSDNNSLTFCRGKSGS
jgi:glutaredoxin 2